ncbi:MAG: DEAD/DEAH box helicase family protein [Chloroflexi bacterium]|nr:DEAD/DEAH box helicase family protein [Chloroflexota bacterium]
MRKLETLLADFPFESLPPAWTTFDLARFSRSKRLWDYQQTALQNAIKTLWKYFADLTADPAQRKQSFFGWYADNNIPLQDISLGKKRDNVTLLAPYYPITDSQIGYAHFINRMSFWMATGSGKTLVIVKLIEVLWALMQRGEIPSNDVVVLTHREDLLRQLREHVNEYNLTGGDLFIRLRELKEYAEVKRDFPSLLAHQEITVFSYRSDNLSDVQKERIIDFRNYDDNGRWYVLLDEAHKGDKEDSKRQHIYSILSRNGFLFNFSATFTDDRDTLTTAAEFNLSSFIGKGYGKHIAIFKQENSAFRKDNGDFTDEEKQKIVLQSLLMLAYVSKTRERLRAATGADLYHRPLLIALVNSVNTDDADLRLFFAQLERIARGKNIDGVFRRAKSDLWKELQEQPKWLYEGERFTADSAIFDSLTIKDVLEHVFNTTSHGEIEVLARPSNEKELAFRLKSAEVGAPFALIRIGDTRSWQKEMLAGYTFVEGFEDESFFERINADDTQISLLMGSRSFYEGWDSNRPNVITFINIGIGTDAKKFVLQSVGRGVRIEPLKGKRRRLENLHNAKEVDDQTFQSARPFLNALQTLFIFGTNRVALESVLNGLDQEKEKEAGRELALAVNPAVTDQRPLLIPVYRVADRPLIEQRAPGKFELQPAELQTLRHYRSHLADDRLLLAHHDLLPQQIANLDKVLDAPETYFNPTTDRKFGSMNILLPRLAKYLRTVPKEWDGFKPLDTEINHYRHIRVVLQDIQELWRKIQAVQAYQDPAAQMAALKEQFTARQLDFDAFMAAAQKLTSASAEETFTLPNGALLRIKNIAAHYYVPLLLSESETIQYINHVIHVPSEVLFIKQLEEYMRAPDNLLAAFDWWLFSRADEILDRIFIPYYDPNQNQMRDFHPDFIFWLKRWNDYFILFVDPKGMGRSEYMHKVTGYKEIFVVHATGAIREFKHNGMTVRVALALHTTDANQAPPGYEDVWFDNIPGILKRLLALGNETRRPIVPSSGV